MNIIGRIIRLITLSLFYIVLIQTEVHKYYNLYCFSIIGFYPQNLTSLVTVY